MNKQIIYLFAILLSKNVFALNIKTTIAAPITVAIIDTGADTNHKDLKNNIWTNLGESGLDSNGFDKANNGIDDDDNGYVDDLHGWNFVFNNNNVFDTQGHGTHIAGIIKTEFEKTQNSSDLKLMILKYYDPKLPDYKNLQNTVKAINYAVKMNAQIINYSAGGNQPFKQEQAAIEQAAKKQIIFIAAAGNNKENADIEKYYPASYELENIISVAATTNNNSLSDFSNFGKNSVHIAAPGDNIFSTLPKNKYGMMSGTSQATAYVSGIAAAALKKDSSLKNAKNLLKKLLTGSKHLASLEGKTKYAMAIF